MDISNSSSKEAIEPQPPTTSQTSETSPPTIQAELNPEDDFALSEMASEITDNGSDDEDFLEKLVKESSETIKDRKQDASKKDIKEPSDDSTEKELQQQSPTGQPISVESERSSLPADEQDATKEGEQLSGGKKSLDEKQASSDDRRSPTKVQQVPIEESEKECPAEGDISSKEVLQESSEVSLVSSISASPYMKSFREKNAGKEFSSSDDLSKEPEHPKTIFISGMKNVPIVAAKQLNTDSIKVVRLAETSGKVKQAVKVGNTPRTVTLTPVVTGGGTSGPATQVLLSGTVTPIVTGEGTSGPATQVLSPGTMTPNAKGGTSGPAKRILTPGTVTPLTGGPTLGPVLQISSPATMIPFAKGGTSGPAKQIILTPGTVTPIVTGGETSGPAKQILSPGTMSVLTPITKGGTSEPAKQILSSGTVTPIVTGGGKPISVGGEKSGPIKLKNYLVGGKLVPGFILEGTKSASGQPILVLPSLNSEGKVVGKASTGTKKQILAEGGASNSVQQISTGSTLGGASGILQQSDIAKGSSSVSQGMATKIGGTSGVQRRVQRSHLKRTSKTFKKPVADDTSERSSSPTSVADHDHDYGQAPKHSKDFCRPSFKIRHRVCSVKNCNNSSEFYPDLKFFRLPKRDNSRLATWAKKIGRPEFVALRKNGKKNLGFVCAAHFHERYKGVSKLMKGAVPTEELPEVDSPENRFLIGGEVKVKPEILSRLHEEENPTAAPVFLSQLRDCTEEHFGTVKLQCLINSDSATVTWYHNGEKIQPCKHMAVKFESKSARVKKKLDYIFKIGVATLQITDPSARYSGVYMCQANSGDKYAVSCAYLSVVDMNTKAAEPLVECRKCRLTFITADKPKRLLDLALPKMKIEMAKSFDNITPSDGDAPPNWMMKLKSTKTRLCKSVILTCMYDDPEASATWYRNGKRLQVCKHYDTLLSASKDRRYAVLRIMPISMDDFGMYTCVAINRRLFASSTSCILSREDEDANSSISIDGSQWPNPDDPKEVGECTKCTMGLEPPKSPLVHDEVFQQLQIEMAQMPDLPEPSVKEKEAPKFLKRLSDVTVDYGGRLILSAMVDDPFASVSWYHKEKLIGTCKHTEMVLSTSSRRRYAVLRIIPAWQDDAGKYTCIARGSVSKKGSISMCQVTVEESDNAIIERYNNKVCRQCPSDPSLPHERKVRVSGVQKLPTIQSVWSLSNSSSKGQFSTPSQNGEASVGQKRKAEDEELPPPPPDTPPRCPSPPLPMHDKDIPPLFVQKLTDRHRNPNSYKLGSPTLMLTCIVNVQSAKHEWYHNGKKLQSCKDTKLIRAVDKKNIGGNQQIALLQIDRLAHEDDGVYTCVATNDAGSISTSCFVGKTVIEETLAKLPILECEKCKRAKKKKVKEESGNKESSTSGGTEETQQDVQKEPEVHVVQYLGNKPPEKNDNAPLVVTRELTGIKDIIERAITLKCRFSHTLLPITWVYMGHQIHECPHYQPEQEVVDGQLRASLKLTSLSPVDMGIYTCLAHNHIDPFVSTSCNLTVKSKPMNEYLKVCKKCICRKAERAAVYDAMMKKRRKLIEWEEANPGSRVPANTDVIHSYSRPRDQVNRLEPKITTIATVKREPAAGVMNVQYVLPKLKGSVLDTLQGDPMSNTPPMLLVPSEPTDTANQTEPDNPRLWSTQPTVKETLADTLEMTRDVANRKIREQEIVQRNALLRKKVRRYQQLLRRKIIQFDKQVRGQVPNKYRASRGTQTLKKDNPQAEVDKITMRHKEILAKFNVMSGRFGSAVKELGQLKNRMKEQELKHEETVNELKEKNADLEAALKRKEATCKRLGKQLQSRERDTSAYSGFIQYMSEPSQEY